MYTASKKNCAKLFLSAQFGTSAFNMVVWWRELGEVENECISHNFSLFTIILPKIIEIGGNLTKF